jgi:hypothetical protein
MLEAGRIAAHVGHRYKSSCLTELFSGRAGYGSVDVGGFNVEVEVETWARADAGGGYLYGQLSHLLGLGLWLAPAEPEDVFARASFLENGCDLDVHASVRLADGVIATFNGHGHQPWVMRHMCDLRIAGEEGVLVLDFERVRGELLLQGDRERGEVLHVGIEPPLRDERGSTRATGLRSS